MSLSHVLASSSFHLQDLIEKELSDIGAVFTTVFGLVEAAHKQAFQPLKDRKQCVEREAKDLTNGLHAEIHRLEQSISMLNNFSTNEDHIYVLQVGGRNEIRDAQSSL